MAKHLIDRCYLEGRSTAKLRKLLKGVPMPKEKCLIYDVLLKRRHGHIIPR